MANNKNEPYPANPVLDVRRLSVAYGKVEAATLEDVGHEIGLTRERVRQIQVEALRRLREILMSQGLSIEALFRTP